MDFFENDDIKCDLWYYYYYIMGNLLSIDIFENNEDHSEEDNVIPENSNSLIEQYAFQVLDFSSQYGYETFIIL